MTDWTTVVLTGFCTGLGIESSKIAHEIWIRPYLLKTKYLQGKLSFLEK